MKEAKEQKQIVNSSFSIEYTIECLQEVHNNIKQNEDIPFKQFCQILNQFCYVFQELNSFLGAAFSDVKQKIAHIKANCDKFPEHHGFISFIKMEMLKNIHMLNGKNNSKKKVEQEFINYSSTSRNLLRMMWLLTFIKVTFSRCKQYPAQSLSSILTIAYNQAFGNRHAWLIRKSASFAMMTSPSRQRFVEVVLQQAYNEQKFNKYNQKFLGCLVPVHDFLWNFYNNYAIDHLQ